MMYAYWAVVAAIVILNLLKITAVSWWVVAAMVAFPIILSVVIIGVTIWAAAR